MTRSAPKSQPSALLLLLLDSRAPTGANAHSGGMEAAIQAGWVRELGDVEVFCEAKLHTAGRVAAAFAAASCRLAAPGVGLAAARHSARSAAEGPTPGELSAWRQLDDEFEARTASEALRTASRQLGGGVRRLLRATSSAQSDYLDAVWAGLPSPAPHHPLVLGAACAIAGATPVAAARTAALGICTASATAALRLLGLDPYALYGLLTRLTKQVDEIAEQVAEQSSRELPADCALTLELLADVHVRSEVRLFAS
jgi:urease accessory protein